MIRNFIWPLIEFIGSYIFIMSLIVPVNPYSDKTHDYVFNVTYVNGDCKDTHTMKWGYARCIGEIPSHMYPFIEECTRHEIIGEVEKREDYIFEEEP